MKDEKYHVYVNNPDGASPPIVNDGKEKYQNDSPGAIRETSEQAEQFRVPETFDDPKNDETVSPDRDGADDYSTGSSEVASQGAASVASSSVGFGALAGVVATAVVAAVIVVVAFVSTLKVNLSLLLRDVDRLVFEIEMTGGQEEDFEKPIFAVLTSDDGTYMEREIGPDVRYLTFDGLEPGREYLIVIKNESKEFVKKSYMTATVPNERGFIETFLDGNEVSVRVMQARLEAGEYYTLVAKDAAGNVLFTRDGVEPDAEYRFTISEAQNVYFSLSIGGMAVALSEIEVEKQPTPDSDPDPDISVTWHWSEDHLSAIAALPMAGVEATVTTEWVEEGSCETDTVAIYTATAEYGGKTYTDSQTVTYPAEGHYLENLVEEVPAGCEEPGMAAHYQCPKCGAFFDENKDPTDEAALTIPETGHVLGERYSGYAADCENSGVAPHYFCSVCDKVFDENRVETTPDALVIPALGHAYGDLVAEVPAGCENEGVKAHYHCEACDKYFDADKNETTLEALTLPATGVAGEPVKLIKDDVSADMIGKKVYLMTDDHSVGVALGQPNNMSADQSLFTEFTITDVVIGSMFSDSKVTLVSPDGYYLTKSYGTIAFTNTNAQAIIVGTAGSLNAGDDTNAYMIVYDEGTIKLESASSLEAEYIHMFLPGAPGHAYGELIPSTATCEDGGTAAHYECAICHKIFDENKEETTLEALAVSAAAHVYGDLIEEDANGNGLAAHYECSVCHKLFDENHVEKTAAELAIGGGTGLHVTRVTKDMLPTSDDPPTADLFDGFAAVSWDEVKDWTSVRYDTFYVIYAFDEGGFYYCTFHDGVVTDSEATLTTASSSSVRDLFIDTYGYAFYYTTGN